MTDIISKLNGIWEFIKTLAGFVEDFFISLGDIFQNIPGVLSFLTGAIVGLPSIALAFASIVLALQIAYFLVGRSPGGSE